MGRDATGDPNKKKRASLGPLPRAKPLSWNTPKRSEQKDQKIRKAGMD